jgi:hypothetical protein
MLNIVDSNYRFLQPLPFDIGIYTDEIRNNVKIINFQFNGNNCYLTHLDLPKFNIETETVIFDKENLQWNIALKDSVLTTQEKKQQKLTLLSKLYNNVQTTYLQNGYFIILPFLQEVENNKVKMTTIASLMNLAQQAQTNGTVEFTQIQGFKSIQDFMAYMGGDKTKIKNLFAKGVPFIFCDWFISILSNVYQHNVTKYNQFVARINNNNEKYQDLIINNTINSKYIQNYDINLIFNIKEDIRQDFIKQADNEEKFITFNIQQPIDLDAIFDWLNIEINKENSELIAEYSADYNDVNRIEQFKRKYNELVEEKEINILPSYALFKDLSA